MRELEEKGTGRSGRQGIFDSQERSKEKRWNDRQRERRQGVSCRRDISKSLFLALAAGGVQIWMEITTADELG